MSEPMTTNSLSLDLFLLHVAQVMVEQELVNDCAISHDWDGIVEKATERAFSGDDATIKVSEEAETHARNAIKWAMSLKQGRPMFRGHLMFRNVYEMVSHQMASSNRIIPEHRNMAASMILAPIRAAKWCQLTESDQHVGRAGEKITVKVKLKRMELTPFEDALDGPTALVEFMGENGVLYKWNCYGHHPELPPKGGFFEITGTIKGHGGHGKQLVTAISRVKVKGALKKKAKT